MLKLALIQMLVEPGEMERNLDRAAELVEQAARRGAQIVLLPEALPFGWMDLSARDRSEEIPGGNHYRDLANLAKWHRVHICSGLVERQGERVYNSAVLISSGGALLLHHRKIYELGIAHACYGPGDRLGVIETEFGRIGLMICADG